jgi:hypothetical protein
MGRDRPEVRGRALPYHHGCHLTGVLLPTRGLRRRPCHQVRECHLEAEVGTEGVVRRCVTWPGNADTGLPSPGCADRHAGEDLLVDAPKPRVVVQRPETWDAADELGGSPVMGFRLLVSVDMPQSNPEPQVQVYAVGPDIQRGLEGIEASSNRSVKTSTCPRVTWPISESGSNATA